MYTVQPRNHERVIRKDRNQSLFLPFSRACTVCCAESPHRRAIFFCGHVICLACAEQLKSDAEQLQIALACPYCRRAGAFVELIEENNQMGFRSAIRETTVPAARADKAAAVSAAATALAAHVAYREAITATLNATKSEAAASRALVRAQEDNQRAQYASRAAVAAYGGSVLDALQNVYAEGANPEQAREALRLVAAAADSQRAEDAARVALTEASKRTDLANIEEARLRDLVASAPALVEAAKTAGKRMIELMRKDNEKSAKFGYRYSRKCRICEGKTQRRRAFFTCGHAICLVCAENRAAQAATVGICQICPTCSRPSRFTPFYEDEIEEESDSDDEEGGPPLPKRRH